MPNTPKLPIYTFVCPDHGPRMSMSVFDPKRFTAERCTECNNWLRAGLSLLLSLTTGLAYLFHA